jgi:hypothetical protein
MVFVSLAWALAGVVIGLIAAAAHVAPAGWSAPWRFALLGAGFALAGGWLAIPVWGSMFATSAALWVGVVGAVGVPFLWAWMAGRAGPKPQ